MHAKSELLTSRNNALPWLTFLAEQGYKGPNPDTSARTWQIKKPLNMSRRKPKYFS
jgi:hypothetical protein